VTGCGDHAQAEHFVVVTHRLYRARRLDLRDVCIEHLQTLDICFNLQPLRLLGNSFKSFDRYAPFNSFNQKTD
jgi:hypothetical protein